MKKEQLGYINGLKGIGAGIVYLCHFVFSFYYGMYSLKPEDAHLPGGIDGILGKSPLNLFFNGNFAVRLFLILSGYVLCLRYFQRREKRLLAVSSAKRYFRLLPPILFWNLVIFLAMKSGWYMHLEAASRIWGSTAWLEGFNHFPPNLWEALKEALYGCFLWGSNQYNGVLWTIQYLFLGSFLVYGCAGVFGTWKWRYLFYGLLSVVLLFTDYAGIFLGFVLCDVMHTQARFIEWIRKKKVLLWGIFFLGIYLSSYPSGGVFLEGTIYGILGVPRVVLFHLAGAFLLVFAVLNLQPLQKFFGWKGFVKLGEISYSLYLVHFPVIATLGCEIFLLLYGKLSYHVIMLLDFAVTTAVTGLLAFLSHKYIEPLSKKGESWIERKMAKEE